MASQARPTFDDGFTLSSDGPAQLLYPQENHVDRVLGIIERKPGYAATMFDGVGIGNDNSNFFDLALHPESNVIKHLVAVGGAAFLEVYRNLILWYKPEAITSGLEPHELSLEINRGRRDAGRSDVITSTHKLDAKIGKDRLFHEVIARNRHINLICASHAQKLLDDVYLVVPLMLETAVRELVHNPALSGTQEYEEEAFMAGWRTIIRHCRGMLLDGDIQYSRNSIWEIMEGVLVRAGLVASRPRADMDMFDVNAKPITLLEIAQKLAGTLEYQLGKGFEPREASNGLAQIRTIDMWLRRRDPHVANAHQDLFNRPADELSAIDELYTKVDPLICTYCAGWLRDHDYLMPEYRDAYRAAKDRERRTGKLHPKLSGTLGREMRKYAREVSERKNTIIRGNLTDANRARLNRLATPVQRRFDPDKPIFGPMWRSILFEDKLFAKLQVWEQAILPFVMGHLEAVQYPRQEPMATMVIADLKGGEAAAKEASERGIADIGELHAVVNRGAVDIENANWSWIKKTVAAIEKARPHRVVVSTLNMTNISSAIDRFRQECPTFVMARGANKTSPLLRLVMAMKFLERHVDEAVFHKGWEHRDYDVQLRVHARLIQAGFVERPVAGPITLEIYTGNNTGLQDSLLVDVKTLARKLEKCADAGVRAPEQALALIRLLALDDLIVDQRLGKGETRIDPHAGSISGMDYDWGEFHKTRRQAMRVLSEYPELWEADKERYIAEGAEDDTSKRRNALVVQNILMRKYVTAMERGQGRQRVLKAPSPVRGRVHEFPGPQI